MAKKFLKVNNVNNYMLEFQCLSFKRIGPLNLDGSTIFPPWVMLILP